MRNRPEGLWQPRFSRHPGQFIPVPLPNPRVIEFPFDILAARGDELAGKYSLDAAACPTVVAIRPGDAVGPKVLDRL